MKAVVPNQKHPEFGFLDLTFFTVLMTALAELGAALSRGNLGFSTIWPPCGLYFAALTFASNPRRDWTGLFLAAALANMISDFWIQKASLLITVCFIFINSISAMSGALVARRLLKEPRTLNGLKEMAAFLGCGLLIQSPLAATSGLWLQSVFSNNSWTWLKWLAWWSSNAIGISCFGIIPLYVLQRFSNLFSTQKMLEKKYMNHWVTLDGSRWELLVLWTSLIILSALLQFALMPPWGLFIINILFLIWSFRFGIIHSSIVLCISCVLRIYLAISNWQYMTPFSEILLLKPPSSPEALKIATIISVQLFLIERAVVVNFAAALFTDLHLKQRALGEAAESRERLMARMSHEIRTPLSGVLGLVEAWAFKERNPQRAQDLKMILNSGAQLKRVIDDVLDFSKLSARKMHVEPIRCNLRELFSEIVSLHSNDAQRKNLLFEYNISEELNQEIRIDALRLRQILNNLIANAIKFTSRGFVKVGAKRVIQEDSAKPILTVTVEDSGIGISQSALKYLFQPFEQIGTETTRAYGGTGLGLAICRELTELLGGRIDVESTKGVGTRFCVQLPYDNLEQGEVDSLKQHENIQNTDATRVHKKGQVLIVEDDLINQIVASRFVEAEGFAVTVVDNGTQALEVLENHRQDFVLVLMDYFMPNFDGCEVTRRFRSSELKESHGSHLPIVGLTASVLAVDHERCRQAGMDDVLLKPIERNALRSVLLKYGAA